MKQLSKGDIGIQTANSLGIYVTKSGKLIYSNGKESMSKPNKWGYIPFNVYINKIQHKCHVHRLQAYQKFGNKLFDPNICVRHLNGDSTDNSFDNIAIGTASENMMDKSPSIRAKQARIAASHQRKFTDKEIQDIRVKKVNGKSLRELAIEYNSSKGNISDIVNRKLYSDVM